MLKGDAIGPSEKDRKAIETMLAVLLKHNDKASPKCFLNSFVVIGIQGSDENALIDFGPRTASANLVLEYADKGLRALNIRLAPITHNPAYPHYFISAAVAAGSTSEFIPYAGQSWPACSTADAACLYVLALTKGPAKGNLHAIAEEQVAMPDIFNLVGKKVGKPAKFLDPEQASQQLGMISHFMLHSKLVTSKLTQEWTGWKPTGPTLLEQLAKYDWSQ